MGLSKGDVSFVCCRTRALHRQLWRARWVFHILYGGEWAQRLHLQERKSATAVATEDRKVATPLVEEVRVRPFCLFVLFSKPQHLCLFLDFAGAQNGQTAGPRAGGREEGGQARGVAGHRCFQSWPMSLHPLQFQTEQPPPPPTLLRVHPLPPFALFVALLFYPLLVPR